MQIFSTYAPAAKWNAPRFESTFITRYILQCEFGRARIAAKSDARLGDLGVPDLNHLNIVLWPFEMAIQYAVFCEMKYCYQTAEFGVLIFDTVRFTITTNQVSIASGFGCILGP